MIVGLTNMVRFMRQRFGCSVRRYQLPGVGLKWVLGQAGLQVPLGVGYGIDPSCNLLKIAKSRNIEVVLGVGGGHLPYRADSFDYVLMMTVICFLDDVEAVFREVNRVLRPRGMLVVGFIEKDGEIYRRYQHEPIKDRFLRFAAYWTVEEVTQFFRNAGFVQVSVIEKTRGFCIMNGQNCETIAIKYFPII